MISLVKYLIYLKYLNIHFYHNCRYKSYITSLKAVIAGKNLISGRLDIHRILHLVFYDKILQIYRQHWVWKMYRHFLSKYRHNFKKWGRGERCYNHPYHPARLALDYGMEIKWLRGLAIEIFKTVINPNSSYIKGIFTPKLHPKVRPKDFLVKHYNTNRHSAKSLKTLDPIIWNQLQGDIESDTSLSNLRNILTLGLGQNVDLLCIWIFQTPPV